MTNRRTRVTESIGDPGKWVAQYFDPEIGRWFDIGDSKNTREEARSNIDSYRAAIKEQTSE